MKDFFPWESVPSKLSKTFFDSELMQTSITQYIRKRIEDAIADAVDRWTAEMFSKKMYVDYKATAYPEDSCTS